MKTQQLLLITILLSFVNAFSQEAAIPGIHQIEHERYKDFQIEPVLSKETPVPLQKKSNIVLTHEIFGYLPYWKLSTYTNFDYSLLTTLAYFCADIEPNGSISNTHGWPNTNIINKAHENGVRVVYVAVLFDKSELTTLLSSAQNRTNCVKNLLSKVKAGNGDGVNIDFEGVDGTQRDNLVYFMEELADSFRTNIPGAHISMATPAVDWRDAWDYKALAEICDALFIMGYGYYWSGSSNAGPIAPLTGGSYNLTNTVNDYIDKTDGMNDKIILGLPYYGYQWPVTSSTKKAATTDKGSSVVYYAGENKTAQYGKLWDSTAKAPWYRYEISDQWYQGWYDDSLSLSYKYAMAKSKSLQGIGMWALGYDDGHDELWGALRDAFTYEETGITETAGPDEFSFISCYPNPANPGTTISFELNNGMLSVQTLAIYNLQGREIFRKSFHHNNPGKYSYYWNGRNMNGHTVPSGIYFVMLNGQKAGARKITIIR